MSRWGSNQPPLSEEDIKKALDDKREMTDKEKRRRQYMRLISQAIAPVAVASADKIFGQGDQRMDMLDLVFGVVTQMYMGTNEVETGRDRVSALMEVFKSMLDSVEDSAIAKSMKQAPNANARMAMGVAISQQSQMSALQLLILTIDEQLEMAWGARKSSIASFFFAVGIVGKEPFQRFYKETAEYLKHRGLLSPELAKAIENTDWHDADKFLKDVEGLKGNLGDQLNELLRAFKGSTMQ